MKTILFTGLLLFATSALGQFVTPVGVGYFRSDAQIEIQNGTGGHALLSIANIRWPCGSQEETALSFGAYNELQQKVQMASISSGWANNCSLADGRGMLRFNVDGADQSSNVEMIIHGRKQGIDLFAPTGSETNPPGGPFVRLYRTTGSPSIKGKNGLVLDSDGPIWLNAYGSGTVVLAQGGGDVMIGKPTTHTCPNGWAECQPMLDSNGVRYYLQVAR